MRSRCSATAGCSTTNCRRNSRAARQQNQPLSLLVLDIDKFKHYNDAHGHAQGDEAIKAVAHALRKHARKPFIACRYGGDEFCVILPGTSAASAAVLAERLRAAVQDSLTGERAITISVGYACHVGTRIRKRRTAVRSRRRGAVLRQGEGPQLRRGRSRAAAAAIRRRARPADARAD